MDAINREVPRWKTLKIEVDDRIARVTLNRPEKLNALSRELMSEIVQLGAWLKLREDIRVMIFSGAGRSFCAGFDLNDFSSASDGESPRQAADLGRLLQHGDRDFLAVLFRPLLQADGGGQAGGATADDHHVTRHRFTFNHA